MSRSYYHSPVQGNTKKESEKRDKQQAQRKVRRRNSVMLQQFDDEIEPFFLHRELMSTTLTANNFTFSIQSKAIPMETKHKVFNLIILDESGSMEPIKDTIISGFNEVVQTVKGVASKFPEQEHYISMVSFNGLGLKTLLDVEHVEKLEQIDAAKYQPQADTPLYDAMGQSIAHLRRVTSTHADCNVLVTILTDGEENASVEFSGHAIKKIVDDLKLQKWTFTYIGANHDVVNFAASISITNTMRYEATESGTRAMFEREARARTRYSSSLRSGMNLDSLNYYEEDPDESSVNTEPPPPENQNESDDTHESDKSA